MPSPSGPPRYCHRLTPTGPTAVPLAITDVVRPRRKPPAHLGAWRRLRAVGPGLSCLRQFGRSAALAWRPPRRDGARPPEAPRDPPEHRPRARRRRADAEGEARPNRRRRRKAPRTGGSTPTPRRATGSGCPNRCRALPRRPCGRGGTGRHTELKIRRPQAMRVRISRRPHHRRRPGRPPSRQEAGVPITPAARRGRTFDARHLAVVGDELQFSRSARASDGRR